MIINTLFFLSNTFISNAMVKLVKNQAKAEQHPEAKLLLFENYLISLSKLSSTNNNIVPWFKRHYMINDNEN